MAMTKPEPFDLIDAETFVDEPFPGSPDDMLQTIASLRAQLETAKAVLRKFQTDMCEGWCEDGGFFHDCQGCEARAALEGKAAP
jgi:hypothetical protein